MTQLPSTSREIKQIAFTGNLRTGLDLISELVLRGVAVTILSLPFDDPSSALLLVNLEDGDAALFDHLQKTQTPWIAWCHGQASSISQAYNAGATAVFPQETDLQTICQFIEKYIANLSHGESSESSSQKDAIQRRYKRGDFILLDTDMVLEIKQGIIAQMMIHTDGCEVLLGLFGKSNLIFPHPADNCYIQLVAQTDSTVEIESLSAVEKKPGFTQDLRFCLQKVEAWAAMQARPHLDQRLLGILSLLAEEFGQNVEQGRLMDLRLTHAQLAKAIGSTRATVTRTISDLKSQGKLTTIETNDGERYCLLQWEKCSHVPSS
jgi:CRP-like cAMP-binding protein